ncbi:MAG: ATP-binding protein, partial [Cocleimonas sp.]|nr:ATP-binding protein [Cocleimonas sp.]
FYVLGREELSCFRLNPFQLLSDKESLLANVATLKATLTAVFPMEAAMPSILEEAIIKAYKEKGWDINSSENYLYDNPWASDSLAWPTFSHMILQLKIVIKSKGMGQELEEKYLGSLVARLSSMTQGIKGRMLDTPYSLDFDQLLDRKVVIELDELKASEDKAIFMGLIMGRVAQAMKQRHSKDASFKHLTLIEEAHRLLARPDPSGGGAQKQGVEMFANLLAEVRKYGEGLIIADQIPNNLIPEVIKNTNTKIIHRLLAADDRDTVGDAMGLNDEQKDFLPKLQAGEAIVYQGGWHGAVRIQIKEQAQTHLKPLDEEKLAEAGQQLLYNNRNALFPHLSQCTDELTPNEFSQLVEQLYKTINLLLKINHVLHDKNNKPNSWLQKLQLRFKQQYQSIGDEVMLADCIQAFAKDAVLLQVLNEDEFKEWVEYLPEIIHALSISTEAFEKFQKDKRGLLIYCFEQIAVAELDSI